MNNEEYIPMSVLVKPSQIASVYALLGAGVLNSIITAAPPKAPTAAAPIAAVEQSAEPAEASPAAVEVADDGEVDTGGWSWSADLHASTKGKTKDGYWRMKVGVSRPDDKPGFPVSGAGAAAAASPEPSQSESASDAGAAAASAAASSSEEDDEFAAFREAAAKSDATDAAAAAAAPARKWTDADLGALCNQAAVKLGDPAPIKGLIAEYVAEGEVAHSRNIAEDKRAAFAAAVEAKAGISFAG
jgi:hypothetical protein